MKKFIMLISVITLVFNTNLLISNTEVGLFGGLNGSFAEYEPNEPMSQEISLNPVVGGVVLYNFNTNMGIMLSPRYMQKKSEIVYILNDFEFNADVLEVPLLFRYEFNIWGVNPYLFLGPSIGFIMDPTYSSELTDDSNTSISEDVEDIEYSMNIGTGIELNLDSYSLFTQFEYIHGINNLYNQPEEITFPDEVRTRNFIFTIGIKFEI